MGKASKTKKQIGLSPEDVEIWHRVSRTVKAYDVSQAAFLAKSAAMGAPGRTNSDTNPAIYKSPYKSGVKVNSRQRPLQHAPEITADKRTRRGKISINRRIDLHDQTQDQAYQSLLEGLLSAHGRGHRCVLVITGKGGVNYKGVLRRMFPIWLNKADIRPMIASYAQAHQRHGGAGAFYVFLKARGSS